MRSASAVPVAAVLAAVLSAGCGGARMSPSHVGPSGDDRGGGAVAELVSPAAVAPEGAAPPAVEDALRRQHDRLRPCWERLALDHPDVAGGRAIVRFQIDPSGRVLSADLLSGPVEDPSFRTCVEQRAREMNFPQGDAPSLFRHAFEFGVSARDGVE